MFGIVVLRGRPRLPLKQSKCLREITVRNRNEVTALRILKFQELRRRHGCPIARRVAHGQARREYWRRKERIIDKRNGQQ